MLLIEFMELRTTELPSPPIMVFMRCYPPPRQPPPLHRSMDTRNASGMITIYSLSQVYDGLAQNSKSRISAKLITYVKKQLN